MLSLLVVLLGVTGKSEASRNTPPVIVLSRNWKLSEDEPVGSRIERVRVQDAERDPVIFSLKPSEFLDGSHFFRIDNVTGEVFLNASLKGQAGAQYYLFVAAGDGEYEPKTEVLVEILPTNGRTLPPRLSPSLQTNRPIPPHLIAFPPPPFPAPPELSTNAHRNSNAVTPNAREVPQNSATEPTASVNGVAITDEDNESQNKKKTSGQLVFLALLPILALVILAPLIGAAVWLVRRRCVVLGTRNGIGKGNDGDHRKSSRTASDQTISYELAHPHPGLPRVSSFKQDSSKSESVSLSQTTWEFARPRLRVHGLLGEGCFGQVWKCEAVNVGGVHGQTTVAVKTLKEQAGDREKKDLLAELEVMKLIEPHPNVVRLLGACTEKDPILVIMEYVEHGKLQTYLRSSRSDNYYDNLHEPRKILASRDLTSFAYQVARGMEYLDSKGIIHRDLAARNVLVGEGNVCKVADFGFARDVMINHVYERKSEGRLPIRWMAPESLYDNVFSAKTDVWSFGVLLWEIVTLGSTPYPGMAACDVMKKVRDGYRLEKPEHCKRELYNIMYYCWDKNPRERPTFSELAQTMEHLLFSDTEYIELDRFPDHSYYNLTSLSGEKL